MMMMMKNIFTHLGLGVSILIATSAVPFSIGLSSLYAYAYDVPEVVDRSYDAAKSIEQQNYRFGPIKDQFQEYSDGSVVPSRTFSIEMWNETSQQWENIGYANTHLHKVKVDSTDVLDISIGTTSRINPKH